jgi:glycosyltransferase involved in cell wall biosynthesis
MRFHLFGLAQIPTCKENTYEPMTPLVWNMAKMLKDNGHYVIFYGAEGSDAPCDEMVNLVPGDLLPKGLQMGAFGVPVAAWKNDGAAPAWQAFTINGRRELKERYRTGDISLISFGHYQKFVAEESELACEFICGYSGIFTSHKVFPSYAWMHYLYGELKMERSPNWADVVIPHYIDISEFTVQENKEDYLLCLGRLDRDKGTDIAIDIANRSGSKIVVAGVDMVTHDIPDWLRNLPGNVEFTGYVNTEQRLKLLQGAKALLHPCRWLEPFGMVLIEAMACGTPVIGSDWGALTEIIQQGITGFRCRNMEEFITAVGKVDTINPNVCRHIAEEKYSLDIAYKGYINYYERISKLIGGGWYETRGTWRGPAVVDHVRKLKISGEIRGAEIGVDRGSLSGYLVRELPELYLNMVDTWTVFEVDSDYAQSGDLITLRTQEQRNEDFAEALRVTKEAEDRRYVWPFTSKEAASKIQDESLDFVFIDADHSYTGVLADLKLWASKVRKGGLICGHDYAHPYFPQWGVTQAVNEYAASISRSVQLGADWTWFIHLGDD